MRRVIQSLLLFTALLSLSLPAASRAQTDSEVTHGPDQFTESLIPGIDILPYPNMPFSGSFTGVRVRKLEDGTTLTTSSTVRVARDSQGRIFRERHYYSPLDTDPDKTLVDFFILDPVMHTQINCIVATKRCSTSIYYRNLNLVEAPAGPFDNGQRVLTRDSLGQKSFGSLTAIGTRETVTISQGVIGNDKPLNLIRDFWYSPDLKTNLQVIRTDPRDGVVTITLNVQSRGEPDPLIFTIPAGYLGPRSAQRVARPPSPTP